MIKNISKFVVTLSILTFIFLSMEYFLYSLLSLKSWIFFPSLVMFFLVLGVAVNMLNNLHWFSKISNSLIGLVTVFLSLGLLKVILIHI